MVDFKKMLQSPQRSERDILVDRLRRVMRALYANPKYPGRYPPVGYIILDTDTTGHDFRRDLVARICWREVETPRCEPWHGGDTELWINWLDYLYESEYDALDRRIEDTRKQVVRDQFGTPTGIDYVVTMDAMREWGQPHTQALKRVEHILRYAYEDHVWVIGHHLLTFDIPMLEATIGRTTDRYVSLAMRNQIDTSLIVLAASAGIMPDCTIAAWQQEVLLHRNELTMKPECMRLEWLVENLPLKNTGDPEMPDVPLCGSQGALRCNLLWNFLMSLIDD